MKRSKRMLINLIVILFILSSTSITYAQSDVEFPDVPKSHWAFDSIYNLVELGYVKGYSNGDFGINDNVTRAQAATILVRWLKDVGKISDKENVSNSFSDVSPSHWAYQDIILLADAGYMNGKGNHNFEPDETVTRSEMAKILVNVLGATKISENNFEDVPEDFWGQESIKIAYSQGLVRGVGDNKYNPYGLVTRAEFAQFIINGINWSTKNIVTTEEKIVDNNTIVYPYKKDYIDTYHLFREDVVIPESDELWDQMMTNQYFKQVISDEGQSLIVDANQKYHTNYQFSILNRSLQLKDSLNDAGFFSILDIYGTDGYRLVFNSKREVEVEVVQNLLQLFDAEMYSAIKEDLNKILTDATYSTGEYSNNTEDDIRIVRLNVPGYSKIYIEIFYKTKGIWIYVEPN